MKSWTELFFNKSYKMIDILLKVSIMYYFFLPECDGGTFGQNCMTPCHCLNDKPCDHINGSCPDNLCPPGWKGNNCSIGIYPFIVIIDI